MTTPYWVPQSGPPVPLALGQEIDPDLPDAVLDSEGDDLDDDSDVISEEPDPAGGVTAKVVERQTQHHDGLVFEEEDQPGTGIGGSGTLTPVPLTHPQRMQRWIIRVGMIFLGVVILGGVVRWYLDPQADLGDYASAFILPITAFLGPLVGFFFKGKDDG